MKILPCGERALLIEFDSLQAVLAATTLLSAMAATAEPPWDRVTDVVPAARTVLLMASSLVGLRGAVSAALAVPGPERPAEHTREVVIPVSYDGPDLAEVARVTGLSEAEVIAAHTGTSWQVAFCGFSPGFAYLTGGDPRLRVPRRDVPRTRVPAGAVGLADEFSGIYPSASPGGWQLIGTTAVSLFDLTAPRPALLGPGTIVSFVSAQPGATLLHPEPPVEPTEHVDDGQGRALLVEAAMLPILVEDAGRPGLAAIGVGASGAADFSAYRLGARLVGNEDGQAALEITAGNVTLRARGALTAALTGAVCKAEVGTRAVSPGVAFTIGDGESLRIGLPEAGLRSYLSLRGGIDSPLVLGSRARDTLGGLGPAPLRAGDWVQIAPAHSGWVPGLDWTPVTASQPSVVELEYLVGPRAQWVTHLAGSRWRVGAHSDRVGVRLEGARLPRREGELPSEPTVRGAVQVPPSGQPVLFLADHPITGGYPVVAVLTAAACDLAAQLRPGQWCRLVQRPVPDAGTRLD